MKVTTLSIKELQSHETLHRNRSCLVNIEIDGRLEGREILLRDPFETESNYDEYRWYVEDYKTYEPYPQFQTSEQWDESQRQARRDQATVDRVLSNLRSYGSRLLQDLKLNKDNFASTDLLHIDVWECPNHNDSNFNLHQLLWETLEPSRLWNRNLSPSDPTINVMVKRIVTASPREEYPLERKTFTKDAPLRVLLVVARMLQKDSHYNYQYTDIKAHLAQIHLLRAQEALRPLLHSHKIQLEILRPGSFEALERLLGRDGKPQGYYDLVHFDLHGVVDGTPKDAYLQFAHDEIDERTLKHVLATKVADLLQYHGVSCVVTNACRSAATYHRREANLSRIFVERGISLVSAMSYKISTPAVDLFYEYFYRAFITEGLSFAESTSLGRRHLRDSGKRATRQERALEDWCVPVTYFCPRTGEQQTSRLWHHQNLTGRMLSYVRRAKRYIFCSVHWPFGIFGKYRIYYKVLRNPSIASLVTSSRTSSNASIMDRQAFDDDTGLPELDIGILDLERQLVEYRILYLHGGICKENNNLLARLSQLWVQTNFVEQVVLMPARYWIDNTIPTRVIAYDRNEPQFRVVNSSKIDYTIPPEGKEIAIIIGNIHDLYPDSEEMKYMDNQQLEHRARGRRELKNFLAARFGKAKDFRKNRIYMIMTGKRGPSWWNNELDLNYAAAGPPFFRDQEMMCRPPIPGFC